MAQEADIEIELLPRERELILKHGYPFPDAKMQLQSVASSRDAEVLMISRFYLNQMIGDLSRSINKDTQGRIQDELIDLCDRLESIERYGEGQLDCWE